MKTVSLCNKRNPTNANTQKLKKAQREIINAYQKEQIEYIQGQINKIRNAVEDRKSCIAWQTVNKVSKRESTSWVPCQEERIHIRKEHFKNLFRKSPKVTDKPITTIINNQWNIKLEQFTQGVVVELTKIKNNVSPKKLSQT